MYCPTCQRKRRIIERRKVIKGKRYWVISCVECGEKITLEDDSEYNKTDD